MAAPMRPTSSQDPGHRPRVADSNFEYDDNEWDIGIGNLIIDLDADIEKTDEGGMASNASPSAKAAATAKMAVEHSATVDKGLKMKIKRTKPGTKSSEAKHEIVKSNEQNGGTEGAENNTTTNSTKSNKHPVSGGGSGGGGSGGGVSSGGGSGGGNTTSSTNSNATPNSTPNSNNPNNSSSSSSSKRGSSGHRRDKKHSSDKPSPKVPVNSAQEVNGVLRVSAPVTQRPVFPASTGPGPPQAPQGPSPGPPASPAAATGSAAKPEQAKISASTSTPTSVSAAVAAVAAATAAAAASIVTTQPTVSNIDDGSSSPPPAKKIKTEPKETNDVCVGTSVGTITEPDCLGPCEPGTSVTLEGIVWHETEGGVLVVNVTWRGKTYVGTLLDCTRHDWAPPRFCDSPTSDLDTRTPKGRGKRGRSAAGATPSTDLSNFTETRSSVHSKLRNGGNVKGRRGAANGSAPPTAPASPTPFIPPRPEPSNKRKSRAGEEENVNAGKKTKVIPVPATITPASTPASTCTSPPPSPVLLECPEPNCSKKYKHINGLKYHQSHAHNAGDDDDTKDVTSMSENDESNIEAPSPATPVKSPEKSQDSPLTPQKKEPVELPLPSILRGLEVPSQPNTPRSTPPSPATPQSIQDMAAPAGSPTVPVVETKSVVKPGVLRYTATEEFPVAVGVFATNKSQPPTPTANTVNQNEHLFKSENLPIPIPTPPQTQPIPAVRPITTEPQIIPPTEPTPPTQSFTNQLQTPQPTFSQPPTIIIPTQNPTVQQNSPSQSPKPSPVTQFKVKPTAALMPEDKSKTTTPSKPTLPPSFKKKNRKSPAGSPDPPAPNDTPVYGIEQSGRDEVQSPAYSDISDDGAPVLESEDKGKTDKKTDNGQPLQHIPQFGMYPFYTQPPYLVPSVQQQSQQDTAKQKETEKIGEKPPEKEVKKENPEYQQQKMLQQHYYSPYSYVPPGYPYNMDPGFNSVPVMAEDKLKEERVKENQSPIEQTVKANAPIPNPIQVPTPGKVKTEQTKGNPPMNNHLKPRDNQMFVDLDHQKNENHQILKESIEMKSQMSPFVYSRQSQQSHHNQHNQREQEVRRFYVFDSHRKDQQGEKGVVGGNVNKPQQQQQQNTPVKHSSNKESSIKQEEKKEKDVKQEGVKPTMETQGPPPPPTSQQYYIHPSYMQSPHYGPLPFDPNHPMYRGIMVPGPYSGNPYLHPQIPRYHGPEDLSRAQPPTKALDMLQHHAQYYSSHKIHELQERAIKSPTPKTSVASSSPSAVVSSASAGQVMPQPVTTQATQQQNQQVGPPSGKQTPGDPGKDSRSPPPQRHVHTHHHTHVGLGYPMYPAPYGAAVLASQQAAAVTVINPYPPK